MKIVGFYQFHEKKEQTGEIENLYCIVEQDESGNYTARYTDDFEQANNIELVNFYRSMKYKSVEELLKDHKRFGRQLNNEVFRKRLLEVYGIDTKDIKNFFDEVKNEEEEKEEEEEKKDEKKLPIRNLKVRKGFFERMVSAIKKYKKRVIAGIAAVAVMAGTVFGCHLNRESKTGDAVAVVDTRDDLDQENEIVIEKTKEEEMNELIEETQNSKVKTFMQNFRDRIFGFNKLASSYQDSQNRILGLTPEQLTAKDMAIFGDRYGSIINNIGTIKDPYLYNTSFLEADNIMTQVSVLQKKSSGLWSHFEDSDIAKFATKYESSMISLNQAEKEADKKKHAEDFLKMFKKDFKIDTRDWDPKELFQKNPKYLAVMPTVKAFMLKAEDSIDDDSLKNDWKKIENAYQEVAKENIKKAITSLKQTEDSIAYEDYMEKIKAAMREKELYPTGIANITTTTYYQEALKLPKLEVKSNLVELVPTVPVVSTITPTPVATEPVQQEEVVVSDQSSYESENSVPSYSTEDENYTVDEDVPTYDTSDENFEYEEDENSEQQEIPVETPTPTPTPTETKEDTLQQELDEANKAIEDGGKGKIPEDFNGIPGVVDDNGYFDGSIEDLTTDSNGVVESEEEVTNESTEAPSTIEESEEDYVPATDSSVEEVPVVTEDATSVEEAAEQAVEAMANGQDATLVYNMDNGNYHVNIEMPEEKASTYTM